MARSLELDVSADGTDHHLLHIAIELARAPVPPNWEPIDDEGDENAMEEKAKQAMAKLNDQRAKEWQVIEEEEWERRQQAKKTKARQLDLD